METVNRHEGHRERLDKKVDAIGLENMPEHEQLEWLLFQIIARANTNHMAHDMLYKFGSIDRVFHASVEELQTIKGIGNRTAKFLTTIPAIAGIYQRGIMSDGVLLNSVEKIGEYAVTLFHGKLYEEFYVISLNSTGRLMRFDKISEGTLDEASVYVRDILRIVITNKIHSVVIAHNHPGGDVTASAADVRLTDKIKRALITADVNLVDHIIVGHGKYSSIKREKLMDFGL